MSSSLRDQLLQLGLVNKAQVNEAERQQQRRERPPPRAGRTGAPSGKAQGAQAQQPRQTQQPRQSQQPRHSQPPRSPQAQSHSAPVRHAPQQQPRTNPASAAQAAQAAKIARDLAISQKQRVKAEKRARHGEIKELIEQHVVARPIDGEAYNFLDGTKIRQIRIDPAQRLQLTGGELLIVRFDGRYHLLPAGIAARVRERDERIFMHGGTTAATVTAGAADDAYAAFVVPDDLIW
jgi:uncharacterized protein YaiL (DUF2058 family)